MIYNYPGTIVLSYLVGTFGNALALVMLSNNIKNQHPNGNNFHVNAWPIESIDCTITQESKIRFKKIITSKDVIQLHCLNAELILYKFPNSKNILLTCSPDDEYFGIQRQWLVNANNLQLNVETILSAWDWINYNNNYYNLTGRDFTNKQVLCLDFKSVTNHFDKIEDYLGTEFRQESKDTYRRHFEKQMLSFYNKHPMFEFAWNVFADIGPVAPINDLAKEFLK